MLSVLELFKIGVGPSSSHTVGPMLACARFVELLGERGLVERTERTQIDLYGSLALTGRGHATDSAVLIGLSGYRPDSLDPDVGRATVESIRGTRTLRLAGRREIAFDEASDLRFHDNESLAWHPNGMRVTALAGGESLASETYYSVGGGFVVSETDLRLAAESSPAGATTVPYEFTSAAELLEMGLREGRTIAQLVMANELAWRTHEETDAALDRIWEVMQSCIERGCRAEGILPGGLGVPRRAGRLWRTLSTQATHDDPLAHLDWVSLFALAVNEENAAGGRVVTAPTNGAAGVIPAVGTYYRRFVRGASDAGVRAFLLTAGAIGMLYKRNASLSAAEVGCQGEVGVASSMAAAGLAAVMGGTNEQVENAAEIAMEHHLGMTCDPIMGLVQVPCIERNTMGAAKAINAARLAVLYGDGSHRVPLDKVIETMRQTGRDMHDKYKETSRGGLAVNLVNC